MKRGRLIACIVTIVILSGGILFLHLWDDAEPEIGSDEPVIQAPEEPRVLISEPIDTILEITFSPIDGAGFSIRRNDLEDEDSDEFELISEDAVFSGNVSFMRGIFNNASGLTNLTLVTENADDAQLALFGLDEPMVEWTVTLLDGTTIDLMLGDMQVIGDGHYARLSDSREVFLLNTRQSNLLTQELEDLYDLTFFPYPPATEDMPTWMLIEHFLLETDETTIEIRAIAEDEAVDDENVIFAPMFEVVQPYVGNANSHNTTTILFEPFTHIAPDRVIEAHPSDLSIYGLDSPARLTVRTESWTGTLLIGNRNAELGGQYVMIEGYDAVLLDTRGSYPFLTVTPSHLLDRLMWIHPIAQVAYVTFEIYGETRILEFEHDEDDNSLEALLDGEFISELNARRLYIGALSIMFDDSTEASIPSGSPQYTVSITLLDGTTDTKELYMLTDTQFLIVRNGENTGFFLTRLSLHQNLLSRFEILDAGGDLP